MRTKRERERERIYSNIGNFRCDGGGSVNIFMALVLVTPRSLASAFAHCLPHVLRVWAIQQNCFGKHLKFFILPGVWVPVRLCIHKSIGFSLTLLLSV